MEQILKEAAEARKFSISLRNVEYGDDLLKKMSTHGEKLEAIYGKLQAIKKAGTRTASKFTKFYEIYDHIDKVVQQSRG